MSLTDEVRETCRSIAESARFVSIDLDRLVELEPGPPPALDAERHYLEGAPEDVADYMLVLDTINFGSGWFPTLRKRPGMSGYFTVAASLAEHWRSSGRGRRRTTGIEGAEVAAVLGQEPDHELMGLYAEALRDLGRFLGARRALDLVAEAGGSAERLASVLAAAMPFFDDRGFWKRAQITPNDLALAGVAEFSDLDRLTIFADNLVPHVLRVDGVLRYDPGWPPGSTPASCCRPARRNARSADARCMPASSFPSASGCLRACSTPRCGAEVRHPGTRACRGTGRARSTTDLDQSLRATKRLVGLVDDLVVGEARDREAGQLEVHVLSAVAFEGSSHRVEGVAVDLDHSPLLAPEEVDLVAMQLHVHLRVGQAATAAER